MIPTFETVVGSVVLSDVAADNMLPQILMISPASWILGHWLGLSNGGNDLCPPGPGHLPATGPAMSPPFSSFFPT